MRDLTGMKFGLLTAKEIVGKKGTQYLWRCECECGGEKIVPGRSLVNQHTRSCGCLVKNIRENSIKKGDRWGRLVALESAGIEVVRGQRRAIWVFRCDCGNEKVLAVSDVKSRGTRSCGCLAKEHISKLRKEDITGQQFGRLTAIRPTEERLERRGDIVWELQCECGNLVYKPINELKTGRVLSCGCLYKESRKDLPKYRKDFVENTSISNIVVSKTPRATNTSGHTGVYQDKRTGKWHAYINYQKKRYFLGSFWDIEDAIKARKEGEAKLHDPVIMEYFANLTPDKKKEFIEYLKSNGMAVEIGNIADEKNEQ